MVVSVIESIIPTLPSLTDMEVVIYRSTNSTL